MYMLVNNVNWFMFNKCSFEDVDLIIGWGALFWLTALAPNFRHSDICMKRNLPSDTASITYFAVIGLMFSWLFLTTK